MNEVYHFLLPDANMLGVRSIKEQKKLHPNEDRRMTTILKDWTAPVGAHEFQILQRISAKIDILLKEHFTDQLTIEKYTNNRKEVWDGIDHSAQESLFKNAEQVESYAQKQRLFDTRYGHNNAYRKLKLVMDYWCALWFWSYDDTLSLPTREEYWKDIEALLAVDFVCFVCECLRFKRGFGGILSYYPWKNEMLLIRHLEGALFYFPYLCKMTVCL